MRLPTPSLRRRRDARPRRDDHDVVAARRHPGDVLHRAVLLLPPPRRSRTKIDEHALDHAGLRPSRSCHDRATGHARPHLERRRAGPVPPQRAQRRRARGQRAARHGDTRLAGLGTFLVIFLHKPFDAMTIGMLMARGGSSLAWRHTVNALFSLAIPLGVLDVLLRPDVARRRRTSSTLDRRLRPGLLRRHVSLHLARAICCRSCSSITTTAANCRRRWCSGWPWPSASPSSKPSPRRPTITPRRLQLRLP